MNKMTPLEFIKHRFPEFKDMEPREIFNNLNIINILTLMEEYSLYRNSEKSYDNDDYDHYH